MTSHLRLASSFNTARYGQMFRCPYKDPFDSTEREMVRMQPVECLRKARISNFYTLDDMNGLSLYLRNQVDAEKYELARDLPEGLYGRGLDVEYSYSSLRVIKKRISQAEKALKKHGYDGKLTMGITEDNSQVFIAADKDTHISLVPLNPLRFVLFG